MQHVRGISRLSPAAFAAVAIAVGVASAQPAAAADLPASGTAQATSLVFTDVSSADGNTILDGIQQGVIAGTLTGTWVEQFRLVVHPDGATNFHSFLTVVGTAADIPPTVEQNARMCGTDAAGYVAEGPGLSVYALSDGTVYRTYVSTARGLEPAMAYYALLDRTPSGRDESATEPLWVRRHDEYETT
jgi:Bacterial protein of unknown function (DUF899)